MASTLPVILQYSVRSNTGIVGENNKISLYPYQSMTCSIVIDLNPINAADVVISDSNPIKYTWYYRPQGTSTWNPANILNPKKVIESTNGQQVDILVQSEDGLFDIKCVITFKNEDTETEYEIDSTNAASWNTLARYTSANNGVIEFTSFKPISELRLQTFDVNTYNDLALSNVIELPYIYNTASSIKIYNKYYVQLINTDNTVIATWEDLLYTGKLSARTIENRTTPISSNKFSASINTRYELTNANGDELTIVNNQLVNANDNSDIYINSNWELTGKAIYVDGIETTFVKNSYTNNYVNYDNTIEYVYSPKYYIENNIQLVQDVNSLYSLELSNTSSYAQLTHTISLLHIATPATISLYWYKLYQIGIKYINNESDAVDSLYSSTVVFTGNPLSVNIDFYTVNNDNKEELSNVSNATWLPIGTNITAQLFRQNNTSVNNQLIKNENYYTVSTIDVATPTNISSEYYIVPQLMLTDRNIITGKKSTSFTTQVIVLLTILSNTGEQHTYSVRTNTFFEVSINADGTALQYQWEVLYENSSTWQNYNNTSSLLRIRIINKDLLNATFRCKVYPVGYSQTEQAIKYSDEYKIVNVIEIENEYLTDKRIVLCKIPSVDATVDDIKIANDQYVVFEDFNNANDRYDNHNRPTILTRDDYNHLIDKPYKFPWDIDVDKITKKYAVASDIAKQKVYIYDITYTSNADKIALPVDVIDVPNSEDICFGWKVFINNNIICVSDPYAKNSIGQSAGKVYVYRFYPALKTHSLVSVLEPTVYGENLSFGENIEFDPNGNILVSASEVPFTNTIYYDIKSKVDTLGNVQLIPMPTKIPTETTQSLKLTTMGVVYVYDKNYNLLQTLNSHKTLNKIKWNELSPTMSALANPLNLSSYSEYYIKYESPTKTINKTFSYLPQYNTWFNAGYAYDSTFRDSYYCSSATFTLKEPVTYTQDGQTLIQTTVSSPANRPYYWKTYYDQYDNVIHEQTVIKNAKNEIVEIPDDITDWTYVGYTENDFLTNNAHTNEGATYVSIGKNIYYGDVTAAGYFGLSMSFNEYKINDIGTNSGIVVIAAPRYDKGFIEIYSYNGNNTDLPYSYVKTIDAPDNINGIRNFGKRVEVGDGFIAVTYDIVNNNQITSNVLIYKLDEMTNSVDARTFQKISNQNIKDYGKSLDSFGNNIIISSPNTSTIERYGINFTEETAQTDAITNIQKIETDFIENTVFGNVIITTNESLLVSFREYAYKKSDINNTVEIGNGAIIQYSNINSLFTLI